MSTSSQVHSMPPWVDSYMDVKPHGQAMKCHAFVQGGCREVGCGMEKVEAEEFHGEKESRIGNDRKETQRESL